MPCDLGLYSNVYQEQASAFCGLLPLKINPMSASGGFHGLHSSLSDGLGNTVLESGLAEAVVYCVLLCFAVFCCVPVGGGSIRG